MGVTKPLATDKSLNVWSICVKTASVTAIHSPYLNAIAIGYYVYSFHLELDLTRFCINRYITAHLDKRARYTLSSTSTRRPINECRVPFLSSNS